MAVKKPETTAASPAGNPNNPAELAAENRAASAEAATAEAAAEGRLPESMALSNPEPATEMESPSGAFIEPDIKAAIPVDHPAIDNNPRAGTSAVQNGGDFNDPQRRHPSDPDFAGQGLDLSVYGSAVAGGSKDEAKDK